jgi:hypothetical protein
MRLTGMRKLQTAVPGLQAAQLAGDAAALEKLLGDRLIFTFGLDGKCYKKRWRTIRCPVTVHPYLAP